MTDVRDNRKLTFRPLSLGRWSDFEDLFGSRGACGGCWCMYWRKSHREFERDKYAANRSSMEALVQSGAEPGVLAYRGQSAVGWCCVAPRHEFERLTNSRILKPLDDRPVWSIVCLFVDRAHRESGVSVRLLQAAAGFAAHRGAEVIEGYPVDTRGEHSPPAFIWTGTAAAFEAAGFKECARRSEKRPIMRYHPPTIRDDTSQGVAE